MQLNTFALVLSLIFLNRAYPQMAATPAPGTGKSHAAPPAPGSGKSRAAAPADPNLTLYGRGLYPGDDTTFDDLRLSGFTTIVLSSYYIHEDGDV